FSRDWSSDVRSSDLKPSVRSARNILFRHRGRYLGFLGGVPQCLKLDNMPTAVVRLSRYEPVFTEAIEYFAAHYGTTAMAARVGKIGRAAGRETGSAV